jgi:hypothetical protein
MIDIFYKSYSRDFKILKYSLMSLEKNVSGYNDIIIIIPQIDISLFNYRIKDLPPRTKVITVDEEGDGYLFQQYCKMNAHKHCNSEFILYADSDCIFDHQVNLNDYIKDRKPQMLYTDYSKVGDAICWKEPTEQFMGQPIQYEFMRRIPLIYHTSTLKDISDKNKNLKEYILNSGRFSEFNAMGAYAFINEHDKYQFINTDNWEYEPPLATQLWSWFESGDDEVHKYEKKRALETINKTLNINLTEL